MTENIDAMIDEIAAKNHVALGKDDPIMILWTMNQRQIREFQQVIAEEHAEFVGNLEALLMRLDTETSDRTKRLLTAVVNAHKEALQESISQYSEKTAEAVALSLKPQLSQWVQAISGGKKHAYINIAASCITFLSVCLLTAVLLLR